MKSITKLMFDKFIERELIINKELMPKDPIKKKDISMRQRWFSSFLKDKETYCSYSLKNSSIEKLITCKLEALTHEKEIVTPVFYYKELPSLKELRNEVSSIFDFYPDENSLVIPVNVDNKKLGGKLKNIGFHIDITQLVGFIGDSLYYLEKSCIDSDITICLANYNKDIKRIIEIEIGAHNSDSTSMVSFKKNRESIIKDTKKHYYEMSKQRSLFVAKKGKKVIGAAGTFYNSYLSIVAGISVDPKYQGNGIGKLLYKKMLEDLKDRGALYYKGFTSTEKVFHLAKKMKRKKSVYYYRISRDGVK